jgi:hypothetical protein
MHGNSYNNSGRLQHSSLKKGYVIETETKQRYNEARSYEPNGSLSLSLSPSLSLSVCLTFHPKTKENTLFSVPHGTFSKVDHIISNKISLNRYRKFEITPCSLSDHPKLWLDFNNNKTTESPHTHKN